MCQCLRAQDLLDSGGGPVAENPVSQAQSSPGPCTYSTAALLRSLINTTTKFQRQTPTNWQPLGISTPMRTRQWKWVGQPAGGIQRLFLVVAGWVSSSRYNLLSRDRSEVSVGSKPNTLVSCTPRSSLPSVRTALHALERDGPLRVYQSRPSIRACEVLSVS